MAEQAPERTEASRPPKGRKILGMTQGQLLIVAGIALVGGAVLLWRRRKAQQAAQQQGAAATGGGGGSGTCPDGSTADCAGLCPDGSTPQGCPDYSGQLSTLQSEIGNLQSGAAQGAAGGGGDGGTIPPAVPGQPGTTPAPSPAPAAGGWAFPAPAVQAHNVSRTGYRLSWQPVTGPNGQKPVSYTIQTTQLNGKKVDQFNVRSTSTAEYGLGGKGLHPGWSYKTEVWANGSPKPSPHSTVQVALKG